MPRTTPATSLAELAAHISEANTLLERALADPNNGLLAPETLILAALIDWPTRTPSDLAQLSGLTRGRITHLTDRLARRDLILRQRDDEDRRQTRISLTAAGRELAQQAVERVSRANRLLITTLGIAGVDMLAEQLHNLRIGLELE
jgi:DNA-binding MarR family transcriptional regulator